MKEENMNKYAKPWWFPREVDIQGIRDDNEGDLDDLSDQEIMEMFELGKYEALWDHKADAYDQYEPLADAFLEAIDLLEWWFRDGTFLVYNCGAQEDFDELTKGELDTKRFLQSIGIDPLGEYHGRS